MPTLQMPTERKHGMAWLHNPENDKMYKADRLTNRIDLFGVRMYACPDVVIVQFASTTKFVGHY